MDVAIINAGQTVAHGDLAEIRRNAGYRRVEVTVGGLPWVPDRPGAVTMWRGERPHALVPVDVSAEELLTEAAATGPITSFRYEAPSLADLFHEAVAAQPPRTAAQVGQLLGREVAHG